MSVSVSVPACLPACGLEQNEWDDLMLETHTLKQHLDQTRQELSQALYQVRSHTPFRGGAGGLEGPGRRWRASARA